MKKFLSVLLILFLLAIILSVNAKVHAQATNNPIFPTREEVQQWISDAVNSLNQLISNLTARIEVLENQSGENNVIFADDFADTAVDTNKWIPTNGWSENLMLTVDGGGIGYTKKSDFSDFTFDIDFQINGRSDYNTANFILRMTPDNPYVGDYYLVQVTSKMSQFSPNSIRVNRGPHILAQVIPIPLEIKNGDWHHFRVKADEYTFSFFIDGRFIGRYFDDVRINHADEPMRTKGAIGLRSAGTPGDIFSDLVNYANLKVTK